jgi:hypothetical protein
MQAITVEEVYAAVADVLSGPDQTIAAPEHLPPATAP